MMKLDIDSWYVLCGVDGTVTQRPDDVSELYNLIKHVLLLSLPDRGCRRTRQCRRGSKKLFHSKNRKGRTAEEAYGTAIESTGCNSK